MLAYDEDGEGRCMRCMGWMPEGAEICVDCEDEEDSFGCYDTVTLDGNGLYMVWEVHGDRLEIVDRNSPVFNPEPLEVEASRCALIDRALKF